jgi:hypothetical protein
MTPSHFCDYLPSEEESPSPIDNLYWPSLIEFGWLVLEKIFKNFQCSFTLSLLSLLGEGQSPSFEQVWLKLAQWFWRRSRKSKSLQTDGQATNDQNSSLELSAQVS